MYGAGMVQENSLWKEHPACSGTGKRNGRPFAKGLLETGPLSLCQKGTYCSYCLFVFQCDTKLGQQVYPAALSQCRRVAEKKMSREE